MTPEAPRDAERSRESQPRVMVLAAPSGTGKTTVARALIAASPDAYRFSTSATTRAPRRGETDGVDYHFLDERAFEKMIEDAELLEWARVHGNLYGTLWSEVRRPPIDGRRDMVTVLDIDVQGALQVRDSVKDAILVFLLPPSGAILLERLEGRGTDDGKTIGRRLAGALAELDEAERFDFVVVNERVQDTVAQLQAIAAADAVRADDPERVRERAQQLKREIREAAEAAF